MLALTGADLHVTTLTIRTVKTGKKDTSASRRKGLKRYRYFKVACTCPNLNYPETWDQLRALMKLEVHARLHHGAEPDRGKWRNPNVELG